MATFQYIARDAAGERVTGKLAGASEQVVLAELQSRNLAPVRLNEVRESRALFRKRIGTRQLATAYRQIADLLRAGVPLLRALRLIGRSKSNPRLGAVFTKVADEVAEGERLADAMSNQAQAFPDVQVAMVKAGERGGFLESVFERMSLFLEHQADTRGKVIGSLFYPALLVFVGVGIVVGALMFLVPQFADFYARIEIPLPTKILLAASQTAEAHGLTVLIVFGLMVAGTWWITRREDVQRRLAKVQMRIPKLGPLVQAIAVARFARILGTLLENGIPLLSAMQISREAAGNILLAEAIDEATEAVRAGESLSKPLADSGMFAEDYIEMIAVGESANNLPSVLTTMADTIEKRIDRMLAVFLRLIEPLLLLGIGVVVVFIALALIIPMVRLSSAI